MINKNLQQAQLILTESFQRGRRNKRIFALRALLLLFAASMLVATSSGLVAQSGNQPVYASMGRLSLAQTPANPFTLQLVGPQAAVTQDVLSGAGNWTFVITVKGNVSTLGIKIKNNPSAGDVCWSYYQKSPKSGSTIAYAVPAASVGICGDQFADINGDPLTVYAYTQGGKADVKISVTYPPQ